MSNESKQEKEEIKREKEGEAGKEMQEKKRERG